MCRRVYIRVYFSVCKELKSELLTISRYSSVYYPFHFALDLKFIKTESWGKGFFHAIVNCGVNSRLNSKSFFFFPRGVLLLEQSNSSHDKIELKSHDKIE